MTKRVPIDLKQKQIITLKKGGSCFIHPSQHGKGFHIPMKKTSYNKMMKNFEKGKKYKLKSEEFGEGFWDTIKKFLFREPGVLPPYSRKLLDKIKDEKLTSLKVVRVPLENTALINALTMNQYYKAVKSKGYDKMFHLSIEINGKYTLEKVAVPRITTTTTKSDAETMDVPLKKDLTIGELIDNTIKYMGKEKFSSYDVASNNCQLFTKSILQANGLLNKCLLNFIEQDVESIYKHLPKYAKVITDFATKLGAVSDKLVYGAGIDLNNISLKGIEFRFSSTEMSHLQDVYITTGDNVIQVFMFYPDNYAIGGIGKIGWAQFPKSTLLGYHQYDVEYIQIYFENNKPVKFVYSCHGTNETNIYDNVQINNDYIVVYVARNSHANYDSSGLKKRVKGLANDVTSNDGDIVKIPFSDMKPISTDISYPGIATRISNNIIPVPENTLTHNERWLIDRKSGFI